jgi:drug/metabolite transporter superfamily protein YnfA
MEFLADLWGFLKDRKKWWLAPMIIILLVFGVLIALTANTAVAPFVYTVF